MFHKDDDDQHNNATTDPHSNHTNNSTHVEPWQAVSIEHSRMLVRVQVSIEDDDVSGLLVREWREGVASVTRKNSGDVSTYREGETRSIAVSLRSRPKHPVVLRVVEEGSSDHRHHSAVEIVGTDTLTIEAMEWNATHVFLLRATNDDVRRRETMTRVVLTMSSNDVDYHHDGNNATTSTSTTSSGHVLLVRVVDDDQVGILLDVNRTSTVEGSGWMQYGLRLKSRPNLLPGARVLFARRRHSWRTRDNSVRVF